MNRILRSSIGLALLAGLGLGAAAPEPEPAAKTQAYVFGLLRRGPAWTAERTPRTDSIQAGHMANIQKMADEGALLAAGPFLDGGDLRGIFIFRDDSLSRLRKLAARDPAIASKRLVLDLYPWTAPPGIGERYKKIAKQPGHRDSMVRYHVALLTPGPKRDAIFSDELIPLIKAHVANVAQLIDTGVAATGGTFQRAGRHQGVYVFRGDSATAARLASGDPAVVAGWFKAEVHPWMSAYGTMPADTL